MAHDASGPSSCLQENMAIALPIRQRQHLLRARRAGAATSMGLVALMGCAGLLDLPSDPQLAEESTSGSVDGTPSPDALSAEPGAVSPESSADVASPAGPVTSESPGGGQPGPSNGGGSSPEGPGPGTENADAGTERVDAAGPGDVPSREPCATTQSVGPDGLCYLVNDTPLSWDDARASCTELGAGWDLAAIHDGVVNAFMSELGAGEAWVGASDAEAEGTWAWVDDGVPFWQGSGATGGVLNDAFENWNSDEPNGGGNSDCARLVPVPATGSTAPTWADLECFELRSSVCSGPAR
jgi:lectin-like protein